MGQTPTEEERRPADLPKDLPDGIDYITVGGGCFWCIDSCYRHMKGVEKVISGYAGGKKENPTYEDICTGQTGHAEVVRVWYYPNQISLDRIFEIFFKVHNPTTLNQQGLDVGT